MTNEAYKGFEQGPIRPPSEANSLLLRITRNCPWNNCTFCPVYKSRKFSLRPVDHIIKDIDTVHLHIKALLKKADAGGRIPYNAITDIKNEMDEFNPQGFHAALSWISSGMESIFIQDANSLIIKPIHLIQILLHLKKRFPMATRITSYARSHTIVRISDENLKKMADAGLNRIHIGMESGSDTILKLVKKGCTKKDHIKAGLKVKKAGMELSEYIMPGLGGQKYSREHAEESADA
ncbi:MAG: radical SAM protein, partial [Desulfobacteraceae bacterium]|nr:radical SAM protein [Desulfobacteraceae bacterium]